MSGNRPTRSSFRTSIVTPPLSQSFKNYSASPKSTPPAAATPAAPAAATPATPSKLQFQPPPAPSAPSPAPTSASAPSPAPPAEQKPLLDEDTEMTDANGEKKKPHWMRKAPGEPRKKRNKAMVQQRVRRHVTPKNAVVALREACPDTTFTSSQLSGNNSVFTAEVVVKGNKFHGIGANKALARAAASELALQSLVKRPEKVTNPDGTESVKDETPWAELASFALHKLFCDWKRGVVGAPLSLESAATDKVVAGAGSAPAVFDLHARTGPGTVRRLPEDAAAPGADASTPISKPKKPRTEKQLPADALQRNPVQILFEMKPDIVCRGENDSTRGPNDPLHVSVVVDDQVFFGTGRSKKLAKREACRKAMKALYGLDYPEQETPAPAAGAAPAAAATPMAVSYQ